MRTSFVEGDDFISLGAELRGWKMEKDPDIPAVEARRRSRARLCDFLHSSNGKLTSERGCHRPSVIYDVHGKAGPEPRVGLELTIISRAAASVDLHSEL